MYRIKVLMRRLNIFVSLEELSCQTHSSICVCSDIEIWASSRLPEVKNSRKIHISSFESSRVRLQEVVVYKRC